MCDDVICTEFWYNAYADNFKFVFMAEFAESFAKATMLAIRNEAAKVLATGLSNGTQILKASLTVCEICLQGMLLFIQLNLVSPRPPYLPYPLYLLDPHHPLDSNHP